MKLTFYYDVHSDREVWFLVVINSLRNSQLYFLVDEKREI
jgi:hypothetical protein